MKAKIFFLYTLLKDKGPNYEKQNKSCADKIIGGKVWILFVCTNQYKNKSYQKFKANK